MTTGNVVITNPIQSKDDGKVVVSVVAPIRRNNQIVSAQVREIKRSGD